MSSLTKNPLLGLILLAGLAIVAVAGFVWSGVYDIGADDKHTRPVHSLLETLRSRSIDARASKLDVPDLRDPAKVTQGAGNYAAMCTGCHLAPGLAETELSRGLYPAPPNLTEASVDPAAAFWVIKHGIKASGMPAWGRSMDDEYIWNMVAFLQELPKLDAAQYQAMVAASGGHDHGGGESAPHDDGPGATAGHDAAASDGHADMDMPMPGGEAASTKPGGHAHAPGTPAHDDHPAEPATTGMTTHRHADGTVESHPAPPTPPADDDGHDHQH